MKLKLKTSTHQQLLLKPDKNNLNKLISTMVIDTAELFSNGTVAVKNQDKFNIESHLLTTRAVFKKYGLEIND